MYECMCVCMNAYVCVCVCLNVYIYSSVGVRTCINVYMNIMNLRKCKCVCTRVLTCSNGCVHITFPLFHAHMFMHTHT